MKVWCYSKGGKKRKTYDGASGEPVQLWMLPVRTSLSRETLNGWWHHPFFHDELEGQE